MTKEQWDVYDIHRIKTGEVVTRGEKAAPGQYRMVVHICIINSEGKMLIQQRQPFKSDWSNLWDVTVGGCSRTGETSQDAAHREVLEEIGLDIDFTGVLPRFTVNWLSGFDDVYVLKQEVDVSSLSLQEEEVQAVRWATHDEIIDMIREGTFITYHESFIDMCFAMSDSYGEHADEDLR